MSKARDLADLIAAGNPLADGAISVSEISDLTATATELNYSSGVTSAVQTQIDAKAGSLSDLGVSASAAELNYTSGVTTALQTQIDSKAGSLSDLSVSATATELNYVSGVTSALQTQIDAKAATASPTFTGTVTIGGVTYPTVDGTAGQILSTDGSGAISFQDAASGGTAFSAF